jgi:curved DNA-binding protein CbpA
VAIVAQGQVSDRPFGRTVYTVAARRFTGELVLFHGGKEYRISWKDGFAVAAQSPSPADSPARQAITTGLVNTTQVSEILRRAQISGGSQLDAIAEVAGLSEDQVVALRRRVFAYQAVRIFALPEARFQLEDTATLPIDPATEVIDPRWLMYNGPRAHYGEPRVTAELGASPGARFRLEPRIVSSLAAFGFGDDEKPALAAMRDRALTVDELAAAAPALGRPRLLCILYALVCADGAAVADPEPLSRPASRAGAAEKAAQPVPAVTGSAATTAASPAPAAAEKTASPAPAEKTAPPAPAEKTASPAPAEKTASPAPAAAATAPAAESPPASARAARPAPSGPASTADQGGHNRVRTGRAVSGQERRAQADKVRQLIADKIAVLDAGADLFQILGLNRTVAPDKVRTSYFELARRLHPDRLHALGIHDLDVQAQRVFAEINRAFGVISNPKKRDEYVGLLAAGGEKAVRAQERRAEEMALKIVQAEEQYQIGEMALRRSQFDVAREHFARAVELNPDEGEHHAGLAWATWCTSADKDAILAEVKKGLNTAIALSPKNPTALFYRGQVAKHRGNPDTAADCFRKVLELDPHHRDAQLELRLLEKRDGGRDEPARKSGGLLDRFRRK